MPGWEGSLLLGALKLTHLNRLEFQGETINESRLFSEMGWRVREVAISPEGLVYLGVDGKGVMRLVK